MNAFKWLLKREFWEHKGAFFWTPITIGAILVLLAAVSMLFGVFGLSNGMQINGLTVTNLAEVITPQLKTQFASSLVLAYVGFLIPFSIAFAFCVFFFCTGALYDDRKDRSVLFWKSLPLSDHATVLSKVVMAIGVAPMIALLVSTIAAMVTALLTCLAAAAAGANMFGAVLSNPATYLAPLQIAAMLPIYALWALPAIGWLLMVSAWARSKPFLWAVGVPMMAGVLVSWSSRAFQLDLNTTWLWKNIIGRLLGSVMPGSWFSAQAGAFQSEAPASAIGEMLTHSWQLLASANIWIGAALGAAMIYAAIRLRGNRDEG